MANRAEGAGRNISREMFMNAFDAYDYHRIEQYLQAGFNPNFYQYFQTIMLTGSEINEDIDPEDSASESTPIELAINRMDFTLITLLLKYGADINFANARGQTPFRSLLSSYVAINTYQVNENGNNNLIDNVDRNRGRLMIKYIEQVVYLITKYGNPDLSARDHTYERRILTCAMTNKYSPRINRLLLESKVRQKFPAVALASFAGTIAGGRGGRRGGRRGRGTRKRNT